jgi:[ribosomal protein S18]-alanine N-acetyltransferase
MSAQLDNAITYARMEERHLGEVVAIERDVHAHPWTRGNFADSLTAGYECWIAYRGDAIAGYAVIMIAANEAHLLNLSVARIWQRRGVGAELTRFVVSISRSAGARRMYLEVRPSNVGARALYLATGFSEVGFRRDYYPAAGGREDAVIMELQL